MASHVNTLYDEVELGTLRGWYSRTLSSSDNVTLTDADMPLQFLTAVGGSLNLYLPAEAVANHSFIVVNESSDANTWTVMNDSSDTIGSVAQDENKQFVSNGVSWELMTTGGAGSAPATTAENDFQVGGGAGTWVKKTLAQTLTILGKAAASGLASLNGSSKVVQDPANATATPTASKISIADAGGKLDGWITDASTTAKGKVELSTTAEINTGTDTNRAMPVDQYVASNRNVRYAVIRVLEKATDWPADATTAVGGDFPMPFTGTLVSIKADVDTAGTTGTAVVDANLGGTTIMDTHKLKWDSTEKSTSTYSGTAAALSTTAVTAGDIMTFDVDTNHTTKSKGLTITIGVRMT
jgi:hypothetical protein